MFNQALGSDPIKNKSIRTVGSDPIKHKEKINISKEIINKTRGAVAPYAARMNHTPLRVFIAKVKYRKLQNPFVGNCRINGCGKCRF